MGFARGLNDTPKMVALLLAVPALNPGHGLAAIALAMSVGGLLQARRVARTMSRDITPMNHGQGLTANVVTGFLVIVASRYGLPVSTTHVSVGAIFGIGLTTQKADRRVVRNVLASWLLTMPVAAAIGAAVYAWLD